MHPSNVAWRGPNSVFAGAMLGCIIPAPLDIPAIRYSRPPSTNVRARSLGNVSVVMNAWAAFSQEEKSFPRTRVGDVDAWDRIPEITRSIGSSWPMTPVDITNVSFPVLELDDNGESKASVSSTIFHASSSPLRPVTAFAHPLFTTNARAHPPLFCSTSSLTRTGAARKVFRVKHAAAAVGVDEVDSIIARSGTPAFFLTPTCSPPTRKPEGNALAGRGQWWCAFEGVGLRVRVMGDAGDDRKRFAMNDIVVVEKSSKSDELGCFYVISLFFRFFGLPTFGRS